MWNISNHCIYNLERKFCHCIYYLVCRNLFLSCTRRMQNTSNHVLNVYSSMQLVKWRVESRENSVQPVESLWPLQYSHSALISLHGQVVPALTRGRLIVSWTVFPQKIESSGVQSTIAQWPIDWSCSSLKNTYDL